MHQLALNTSQTLNHQSQFRPSSSLSYESSFQEWNALKGTCGPTHAPLFALIFIDTFQIHPIAFPPPLQVDEIMLTLKQAFSVAALQQNAKSQSQQCDSCPMQQLHRLCERIEGIKPSTRCSAWCQHNKSRHFQIKLKVVDTLFKKHVDQVHALLDFQP